MLEIIIWAPLTVLLFGFALLVARFWVGASRQSLVVYLMVGTALFCLVALYSNSMVAAYAVGIYAVATVCGVLWFLRFLKQGPMTIGRPEQTPIRS